MLKIDGSHGEGGGQILRTSLALSALSGRAVEIERVRAGRSKPGLLRQHLTAVRAAAEICGAEIEGDELGSGRVAFRPGAVRPGHYHFAVGTAGSANLVLQTVLPPLMLADGPSTLVVEGGTHNPNAPTFDYLDRVYFGVLRTLGVGLDARLARPGFFPAGGGALEVDVTPPAGGLGGLELLERGALVSRRARAMVANLPGQIARRELSAFSRRVDWPSDGLDVVPAHHARGPGNVFMAELEYEQVTEMFTVHGARGVRAEQVGTWCADEVRGYLKRGAPVGEHLADQLMIPLALGAGGVYRTGPLSEHSRTNRDVIRWCLDVELEVEQTEDGVLVRRT